MAALLRFHDCCCLQGFLDEIRGIGPVPRETKLVNPDLKSPIFEIVVLQCILKTDSRLVSCRHIRVRKDAARLLGVSYKTLLNKIQRYQLDKVQEL